MGYGFTQMFEDEMKPEGWSGAQPPYLYRPGTCFGQKTCHWSPDWARPKDTSWSLISECRLQSFIDGNLGSLTSNSNSIADPWRGRSEQKKVMKKQKRCGTTMGTVWYSPRTSYLWTSSFGDWWKSLRLCMVITWKRMKQCQPLDLVKGLVFFWQRLRDKNLGRTCFIGSNMGKGQMIHSLWLLMHWHTLLGAKLS